MIEVRIRHEDDAKAVRLCDWPVTELDRLIRTLKAWSVLGDDGNYHGDDLFGSFVLSDGEAYFEVVISNDDGE